METYISILRGINVSGKKLIKMAELKAMYEIMGFAQVITYIQSGNVIFEAKKTDAEKLAKAISHEIFKTFNFEVPVLVKTIEDWEKIISHNPFILKNADLSKLHVTLLSGEADKELAEKITAGNYADDEFTIIGENIYLFCPGGYGNTKLTNNFFESKLKINATTRNWNTINKLMELAKESKKNILP